MIIDSHLHLPADFPDFPAKRDALMAELQRNGVSRGIVIADSETESVIGSVRDCTALFHGNSAVRVVAGISPLIRFSEQLHLCRSLLAAGEIIGLKLYTGHESFYCTDPVLTPVYELAAEFSVPVLFHTGWSNAQYAAPKKMKTLAMRFPQNTFVYCHCFYPFLKQCFAELSECRNVCFDISSVADDPEIIPQIQKAVEASISEMPERFLFGSDFGSCSQRAHLDFAAALDITAEQRALLMCGNACRVYHWEAAEQNAE